MSEKNSNLIAKPTIVLREEFEDWAILFDPDTGNAFGINPVSVFVWKLLDGMHSLEDILCKLKISYEAVPDEAETYLKNFIEMLIKLGLAGQEFKK
jgi:SynChlorMet cassette protein ScmD